MAPNHSVRVSCSVAATVGGGVATKVVGMPVDTDRNATTKIMASATKVVEIPVAGTTTTKKRTKHTCRRRATTTIGHRLALHLADHSVFCSCRAAATALRVLAALAAALEGGPVDVTVAKLMLKILRLMVWLA